MPLKINDKAFGLNARKNMLRTNKSMLAAFSRLSSGVRIGSASDDAAGLAISQRFGAQIRSLNMGIRNANDGVSTIQTADAALGSVSENLTRVRELAVQASNGTLTATDRQALQQEAEGLVAEIRRTSGDTEFNTHSLLDGSFTGKEFHIGTGSGQTISVSIEDQSPDRLGTGAAVTGGVVNPNALGEGDLNINGVAVGASASDGVSSANPSGSAIAKAEAINAVTGQTGVSATVEATAAVAAAPVAAGSLGAGELSINGVDIAAVDVQAGDGGGSLESAINAVSSETGVTASVAEDGTLSLNAEDGRNIEIGVGGGAAAITGFAGPQVATGRITLSSMDAFSVSGANPASAGLAPGSTAVLNEGALSDIDLSTAGGAQDALATLDTAIDQVSRQRGRLGATENRLSATASNLRNVSVNLSSARSTLADSDMAQQQAELAKALIQRQAGVSIMSQGNLSTKTVLSLLS